MAWPSPHSRRANVSEANGLRDLKYRAYELREQAGKPNGRDRAFYHQAEQEMQKATEQAFPEQPR
jgi:hypothetical protein